jgi:hypothetical protein
MVQQDGSTHEWVSSAKLDLIVTMDDVTSEIYSGFFVDEARKARFQYLLYALDQPWSRSELERMPTTPLVEHKYVAAAKAANS